MNKKLLTGVGLSLAVAGLFTLQALSPKDGSEQLQTTKENATEQASIASNSETIPGHNNDLLSQLSEGKDLLSTLTDSELLDKLEFDDRALSWAKVDLDAIRDEIPDNLYWEMAAPTQDEALKAHREERREALKQQANLISAKHATEEQIREYFAYQNQLSNDYVEFSTILLNKHRNDMDETDVSMQTLALQMHLSRLQEIPGKLAQALKNREEFVATKNEWLANKDAYETKLRLEREAALKELGKI